MTDTSIDIKSLCFSIRGNELLHDISVQIGKGEMWSIIGPNGAGKSTLLKCLMRIHTGWSGTVRLYGRNLASYSQRELARSISYVPQPGGDQHFPYTAGDFVRMGRFAYSGPFGTVHQGDGAAIESAMQRAGVDAFSDRKINTLSGGERQKVFIAAALAQGGDILLLDEPTAFLDYRHQAEVSGILRTINIESGVTVMSVTHDVNAAMAAGGNVLALCKGSVAWTGKASELASERILERIFDASFRFVEDPVSGLRLVAPQGERA